MPLDPVLAQGIAPINFAGPDPATKMNQLAMMMKMQGLQSEGQLNALKLTETQREMADVEAMREAIRTGADFRDPKIASQYGAKGLAMNKALLDADSADLDRKTKIATAGRDIWSRISDQTSYEAALPELEALRPGSTANLPPMFDPKMVAENVMDAKTFLDQYKPDDFERRVIAAGYAKGSPEYTRLMQQKVNLDTTRAPTEAGGLPADARMIEWLKSQDPNTQALYLQMFGKGQMTPYQAANLEIEQTKEARIAAEAKAKEEAAVRAAEATAAGAEESARIVNGAITKAKGLVSRTSTGFGSLLSGIPTTDARALEGQLNVVKANLGFDRLRQMREESKTGGALGSIAVKELERLEAAVATLDTGLKGQQLIDALDAVSTHYNNWLAERQKLTKKTDGAPAGGAPTQQVRDAADAIISGGK
jgi:hypothetical protein